LLQACSSRFCGPLDSGHVARHRGPATAASTRVSRAILLATPPRASGRPSRGCTIDWARRCAVRSCSNRSNRSSLLPGSRRPCLGGGEATGLGLLPAPRGSPPARRRRASRPRRRGAAACGPNTPGLPRLSGARRR
jgi:hypothetical protein